MTARHAEVADDLRRLIADGTFPVGARLPPETKLAAEYGVSTPTLRDALEVLRAEGLVVKFQGRGNFVSTPPDRLVYLADTNGMRTKVTSTAVTATELLAGRLDVPPESLLTEYTCLTYRDETPYVLARVYLPRTGPGDGSGVVPPQLAASALPWGAELLTATGVPVTSSEDSATARFPSTTEAQLLRIGTRTPVLAVDRTFTGADDDVLGCALLVLPGDRAAISLLTAVGPHRTTSP